MLAFTIFLILCIGIAMALAMRRAPIWAWAAVLLVAGFVWVAGLHLDPEWPVPPRWAVWLAYAPSAILALLAIPPLRPLGLG